MYVCGITPYDTTHLGHAFTYVFFDSLIKFLNHKGYTVTYTQNVTDINDRDNDILKRAKEQGIPWQNLANFWTDKFLEDMHELNWTHPDHFLWASAHIPAVIKLINRLLENGLAYKTNGGVYLEIKKVVGLGRLSQLDEKQMLTTAAEFDEDLDNKDKKHPLDITLWRPTNQTQPQHIPSFDSPFGEGRPGWHIECSAMGIYSLGEQIDIHGGGIDLIYPHHESEIAQSEGATGKIPYAKYWMHTQLVSYKGEKMSKSVGNLVLISELLQRYSANAIRYMLLSNHYREPWEFKEEMLSQAEEKMKYITKKLSRVSQKPDPKIIENQLPDFVSAMENDMNTEQTLKILLSTEDKREIIKMANILGFKF